MQTGLGEPKISNSSVFKLFDQSLYGQFVNIAFANTFEARYTVIRTERAYTTKG